MSKNDITGDSIKSRPLSKQGEENWDKIFGKKPLFKDANDHVEKNSDFSGWDACEKRMRTIGQNGNDGLHYEEQNEDSSNS